MYSYDRRFAKYIVETRSRKPGINDDGTVTVLHGTSTINAALIREQGFKPFDAMDVATVVAEAYGLKPRDIYDSVYFEFPRGRRDVNKVFFTSSPETAQVHGVPESIQDALTAVWAAKHPEWSQQDAATRDDVRKREKHRKEWIRKEAQRFGKPETLAVTLPWEVVGDNAFGKKLSLERYLEIVGGPQDWDDLLHNFSLPISALRGTTVKIAPYR